MREVFIYKCNQCDFEAHLGGPLGGVPIGVPGAYNEEARQPTTIDCCPRCLANFNRLHLPQMKLVKKIQVEETNLPGHSTNGGFRYEVDKDGTRPVPGGDGQ